MKTAPLWSVSVHGTEARASEQSNHGRFQAGQAVAAHVVLFYFV